MSRQDSKEGSGPTGIFAKLQAEQIERVAWLQRINRDLPTDPPRGYQPDSKNLSA